MLKLNWKIPQLEVLRLVKYLSQTKFLFFAFKGGTAFVFMQKFSGKTQKTKLMQFMDKMKKRLLYLTVPLNFKIMFFRSNIYSLF